MSFSKLTIGALMAAVTASACEVPNQSQTPNPPPAGVASANNALFLRLNGVGGIRTVMTDFVNRALSDPRINGYFLNRGVDSSRVIECLVTQVGEAAGGGFSYAASGCRSMKDTHRGLKISQRDFDETVGHLVGALSDRGISQADIAAIIRAVEPTRADIVEDPMNNMTVYQRVGRKPGIAGVVVTFMTDIFNDPRVNGFFAGGNADRLRTCLTRMVCGIDGPCKYGLEVSLEPGVSETNPCKDMLTSHQGIAKPRAITIQDFNIVVETLVGVLRRGGVSQPDINAITAALGPYCKQIVANGTGC
jgi:hemoglobin